MKIIRLNVPLPRCSGSNEDYDGDGDSDNESENPPASPGHLTHTGAKPEDYCYSDERDQEIHASNLHKKSLNKPYIRCYSMSMHFHIITLFPHSFDSYLGESILKRAIKDKKLKVSFYNPRDYTPTSPRLRGTSKDKRAIRIDKPPYGGGPGMVIQAEPVAKAIDAAIKKINPTSLKLRGTRSKKKRTYKIIFLSPSGKQFTNEYASSAARKYTDIIIVSGRYEGIDARVKRMFKMDTLTIGPFVLTGGELPAMLMIDVIARQVEGVLGNFNSVEESRVASPDVYTRPEVLKYKGKNYRVPKVLLSGDHKKIEEWKRNR